MSLPDSIEKICMIVTNFAIPVNNTKSCIQLNKLNISVNQPDSFFHPDLYSIAFRKSTGQWANLMVRLQDIDTQEKIITGCKKLAQQIYFDSILFVTDLLRPVKDYELCRA